MVWRWLQENQCSRAFYSCLSPGCCGFPEALRWPVFFQHAAQWATVHCVHAFPSGVQAKDWVRKQLPARPGARACVVLHTSPRELDSGRGEEGGNHEFLYDLADLGVSLPYTGASQLESCSWGPLRLLHERGGLAQQPREPWK